MDGMGLLMFFNSCSNPQSNDMTNLSNSDKVIIMSLDPGHFHAG